VGADLVEQAGRGEVIQVVTGEVGPGAGLAVAGDGAVDDARIDRPHRLVADAELVHHAGPEALENHVGIARQAQENLDARRLLQVQAQALLVAIDDAEEQAVAAFPVAARSPGPISRA
jgi:hypothetical protein